MKFAVASFLLLLCEISIAQSSRKLHYKAVLIDTHNDVLSSSVLEGKDISHRLTTGHSDLDRWKEGGLDVQFFSVWTDKTPRTNAARPDDPVRRGFFKDANQEIDSLEILTLRNPTRMTLATTYKQVKKGIKKKEN